MQSNRQISSGKLMFNIILILVLLVLTGYGFWRWNTQPIIMPIKDGLLVDLPQTEFNHHLFSKLLESMVDPKGRVDYQRWYNDPVARQQLDQYLALVAKYSPENAPQRFQQNNAILSYWIYAYNAQVIKTILQHWPLKSVTDLKAPVELVKGLGFFYKQQFVFGGETYNLYQIENGKIFSGEVDPRVHFVLNCGSESCPVLRPQLPVGEKLEPFLKKAASEFIEEPKNLHVDATKKVIRVSAVFEWYKKDFIAALKPTSIKNDGVTSNKLLDYLIQIASPDLSKKLTKVRDYPIEFSDYDWSINNSATENNDNRE